MATVNTTPLFSKEFLEVYLEGERLSVFGDVRKKTNILSHWIASLKSGKLHRLKEESIKSRFVTDFFGDILGYNYGNSKYWQLQEEIKNQVDSRKADAGLGYFKGTKDGIISDVRAVVEIKGAGTDLDARPISKGMSPVEQAFNYSNGQGEKVKWVIVSNIIETRFYSSNSRGRYQVFLLEELDNNDKLKELLFLFHKDHLINQNEKSRTDGLYELAGSELKGNLESTHIVDKMYDKLKQFEGLSFIDPNYLCTLKPFNILDEHVWHYESKTLFTINPDIYDLLVGLSIRNGQIELTEKVKEDLTRHVLEFDYKLDYIFKTLYKCYIFNVVAIKDYKAVQKRQRNSLGIPITHIFSYEEDEAIELSIEHPPYEICDCVICNHRSLDFVRLSKKIKSGFNNRDKFTFENAYGNYLMGSNDFKNTYAILKAIAEEAKGEEYKEVHYFLAKLNMQRLHNLILGCDMDDQESIINDIKSIDMDKVVYNGIEYHVSNDVKRYLLDIKNDELINRASKRIEEYAAKIAKVREEYKNGVVYLDKPDHTRLLLQEYLLLFLHVHKNFIVQSIFTDYKQLTEKTFNALIQSYLTIEPGISSFYDFIITEAILHLNCSTLSEIMKDVTTLEVDSLSKSKFLKKMVTFLNSYTEKGLFGDPLKNALIQENLLGFSFRNEYRNIFANLFLFLQKINFTKDDLKTIVPGLINYLKVEDELAHFHIQPFVDYLRKKGDLFTPDQLYELLKIAIGGDKRHGPKYRTLIEELCRSLNLWYPEFKISDKKIVLRAVSNCYSESGNNAGFSHIIFLLNVLDEPNKKYLFEVFDDYLDEQFDGYLYGDLIRNKLLDYDYKNYFEKYLDPWVNFQGTELIGVENGHPRFSSLYIYNTLILIYVLDIDFEYPALKNLEKLSGFEKWLLNPINFDYKGFETDWLIAANNPYILKRIGGIKPIKKSLERRLKQNYDSGLSEIYHRYFA